MQFMIIDPVPDRWVYGRDARVTRPLQSLSGPASNRRLPVLAPEVQLRHKSAQPRLKDHRDFDAVIEHLDTNQRRWLRQTLALVDPSHEWLSRV